MKQAAKNPVRNAAAAKVPAPRLRLPLRKDSGKRVLSALAPVLALSFLVAAISAPLAVHVEADSDTYYRWNDEQGKLVVSDRPPIDSSVEYQVVSQRSTLMRRVSPGEGAVPPEVTPRPGNEFDQVDTAQRRMESIARNPESCARARENLETLNGTSRIRIRDENTGELRFLSEEEKDVQRTKANDIMRVHCG